MENKTISSTNENRDTILVNIADKIKTIMDIQYHYNLGDLFNNLKGKTKAQKEEVYESIINYYLEKITTGRTIEDVESVERDSDIDEIMTFFTYTYFSKDEESKHNYFVIEEEAECVVDDLIAKICGRNKRNLKLPLKLKDIKDFCIENVVKEKDIESTIMWMILKLAVLNAFLDKQA